jgi:hypothetical protein
MAVRPLWLPSRSFPESTLPVGREADSFKQQPGPAPNGPEHLRTGRFHLRALSILEPSAMTSRSLEPSGQVTGSMRI